MIIFSVSCRIIYAIYNYFFVYKVLFLEKNNLLFIIIIIIINALLTIFRWLVDLIYNWLNLSTKKLN